MVVTSILLLVLLMVLVERGKQAINSVAVFVLHVSDRDPNLTLECRKQQLEFLCTLLHDDFSTHLIVKLIISACYPNTNILLVKWYLATQRTPFRPPSASRLPPTTPK